MICERCGLDRTDVCVRLDPYSLEIYDERIEMTLCDDCYQERADDI